MGSVVAVNAAVAAVPERHFAGSPEQAFVAGACCWTIPAQGGVPGGFDGPSSAPPSTMGWPPASSAAVPPSVAAPGPVELHPLSKNAALSNTRGVNDPCHRPAAELVRIDPCIRGCP